jgi:pimeloyl-ACP methyl ester carboxylesterase
VRSAPLFIDSADDTVAAVVSMPDKPPEGLVIVLAGTGRHVVIGGTLAALLAEPLGTDGLATLRLDYAGVGDSPGVVSSWTAADVARETASARAAVTRVREVLGVDQFVSVGTCFGSRVALQLASDPACIGTVCIAPPILDPGSPALARRALGKRRVVGAVRSLPLADTVLKPVAKRLLRRGPSSSVLKSLSHLDRARIVFLYGQPLEDDHYDPRGLDAVNSALANLPEAERARFTSRLLDAGPLTIFDSLDAAAQEEIVQTVADEVHGCFSRRQNAAQAHA